MTTKQFFRSTAFKSILVLLCITLICGTILAIANDVFAVTEDELLQRAVKKIYGENKKAEKVEIQTVEYIKDIGSINELYLVEDGNYLIKATGLNGFNGGTVTVWIKALTEDKKFSGIDKVIEASNTKQTLMSMFEGSFYSNFTKHNDKIANGDLFVNSDKKDGIVSVVSGATYSSNAINNAVNSAILYMRIVVNKESLENIPYGNLVSNVSTTINGEEVTFELTANSIGTPNDFELKIVVDANGLKAITVVKDGSSPNTDYSEKVWSQEYLDSLIGKKEADLKEISTSGDITTGATISNKTILNGLLYATANYSRVLEGGNK